MADFIGVYERRDVLLPSQIDEGREVADLVGDNSLSSQFSFGTYKACKKIFPTKRRGSVI